MKCFKAFCIGALIGWIIGLCLVLAANDADAQEFHVIELNEVSVDYWHFKDARDPLFWDSVPKEELDFHIDFSLLKYGFINSELHSMTQQDQFHVAGLAYQAGVHIAPILDVFVGHQSTHVLDSTLPGMRFPVEDYYGIKLFLLRKQTAPDSLIH